METIGHDLQQMHRTPLADSHVEALRAAGTVAAYPAGVFLARPGVAMDRFIYIEEGEVEVVDPYTDQRLLPFTLQSTQFMGEISILSGGAWSMSLRTARDTRVIEVPREALLTLMSRIPEMSDIIITVLSARRRRQLESRDSSLRLIGEEEDRNVRLRCGCSGLSVCHLAARHFRGGRRSRRLGQTGCFLGRRGIRRDLQGVGVRQPERLAARSDEGKRLRNARMSMNSGTWRELLTCRNH